MKTWQDYKKYVKAIDSKNRLQMEEVEMMTDVVNAIIQQRKNKGLSQRELAALSGVKQPQIARIETLKSTPQLDTLLKLLAPLGYKLSIVPV
ncbi:MAG: helix-turn-helix domain-containing protein [Acidaminococcaceae bacterium]|nr:helix-turn-helix domain-containing protein [Acidaminococcaceae bacterium]